jgi:3-methyladenine DNA glycosylase/8-oxoguanine DNA glycosylase
MLEPVQAETRAGCLLSLVGTGATDARLATPVATAVAEAAETDRVRARFLRYRARFAIENARRLIKDCRRC